MSDQPYEKLPDGLACPKCGETMTIGVDLNCTVYGDDDGPNSVETNEEPGGESDYAAESADDNRVRVFCHNHEATPDDPLVYLPITQRLAAELREQAEASITTR